jgi:restriction endonuclease S subunit
MTKATGRWETPESWQWCLLPDVTIRKPELGDTFAQLKYISDEGNIPLIQSADVGNSKEISPSNKISLQAAEGDKGSPLKLFTGKQLLVTIARETMGRVSILNTDQQVAINNAVVIISPDENRVLLDFLYYYFLMNLTRSYLKERVAPERTYSKPDIMDEVKVVVPPKQDQQRILQRIEALSLGIETSRHQLVPIRSEIPTIIEQAIINTFTPLRVNNWTGRSTLRELLGDQFAQWPRQIPLSYEHYAELDELLSHVNLDDRVFPGFLLWSLLAYPFTVNGTRLHENIIAIDRIVDLTFPHKDEQQYIVNRLNAVHATISAMQQHYKDDLHRLDELEQNILQKAFQGRL